MNEQERPVLQPQNNVNQKQKLPNAGVILGLGIASIATCCCYGVVSIITGVVALVLAKKELELYNASPDLYSNYDHLKIGRILSFIGIGFGVLYWVIYIISMVFYGGMVLLNT